MLVVDMTHAINLQPSIIPTIRPFLSTAFQLFESQLKSPCNYFCLVFHSMFIIKRLGQEEKKKCLTSLTAMALLSSRCCCYSDLNSHWTAVGAVLCCCAGSCRELNITLTAFRNTPGYVSCYYF